MQKWLILIPGLFLLFSACKQVLPAGSTAYNKGREPATADSLKNTPHVKESGQWPDYIIFGIFCGECEGECATLFRFNRKARELRADHKDGFWNYEKGGTITFATAINDTNKINLARQVLYHIPDSLLNTTEKSRRFGCPDCTDECGIYFEMTIDGAVRKFYMDSQANRLSGEIKIFAEYLKKTIIQLKKQ